MITVSVAYYQRRSKRPLYSICIGIVTVPRGDDLSNLILDRTCIALVVQLPIFTEAYETAEKIT